MARTRSHTRRTPRANPRGVLISRAEGFGFVQTSEGEFFVPSSHMNGAFDGDLVELAPVSRSRGARKGSRGEAGDQSLGEKPVARVLRVVERAHDTVVGRYEVAEPFGVVVPADARIPYDIFTMRADYPDVPDGALVRVRIAQFPTRRTAATGVIEEVLGMADDASMGVDLIIARHKLETVFSEAALSEAATAVLDEDGALNAGYRDLRDRFVLTVDPADAKDFDDAVSLCKEADGIWRLGVHIADVSHYVPWNSSLDLDARRRATSVYLVDRVVPMLPHELSNELCSLKPGETRRAMTVDVWLDASARVLKYDIYPSLIRSRLRMTYDEAQEVLESCGCAAAAPVAVSPEAAAAAPAAAAPADAAAPAASVAAVAGGLDDARGILVGLSEIARLRAAARVKAGGIDFDTVEAKVRLDADGNAIAVDIRTKTAATELIEEAMILANETVAGHLSQLRFPCLYRVHEQPAGDGLAGLVPVFQEFPWFAGVDEQAFIAGSPHAIQETLAYSRGRSEAELVSSLLLRSMKRALYRPDNGGHYGLASGAYAHFTSPIRRYPDLVVHRMLKAQATKRPEKFDQEVAALPWIAEHSSDMERVADAAARDSQELKLVEYLSQYVGMSFSGVVSGVATYGLYVKLENTAEGLLPVRSLGQEYWAFDPLRYTLTGMDSGKAYRLGQRVAVVLVEADTVACKLEFRLASGKERPFSV